jgi:serine/threonine-protein kinase
VGDADEMISVALMAVGDERMLGRYELLAPVGRGGMGVVWAARFKGTRGFTKTVALKTIQPSLSLDRSFEEMFLREAELASRIRHPNVCQVLDVGEERGVLFMVMEWSDGVPLSALLAETIVPCGIAARLGAKAARGLHAAHDGRNEEGEPEPIVHRDVSPHNILVGAEGHVQVVDFGIAKAAGNAGSEGTKSGYIRGKVGYVAPEQVHGEDVDPRADVFALGVVLYELTTGVHPFRGPTELATLMRIGGPDAAPPPALPAYPAELWAILERATQKDRAQRHASMRELASELDTFAVASGTTDDDVASFVDDALRAHRKERARVLRAAMREADDRPQPAAPTKTQPRRGAWFAVGIALASVAGVGAWSARSHDAAPPVSVVLQTSSPIQGDAPPLVVAEPPTLTSSVVPVPSIIARQPMRLVVPTASASPPTTPPTGSSSSGTRFRTPDF